MQLNRELPPSKEEIDLFQKKVDFNLPKGFMEFMSRSNGAIIDTDEDYVHLWALTELFDLNLAYDVDNFASEFFLIGSDGGDTAYCIEKRSGHIHTLPFIGMSNEEAILFCESFNDFLNELCQ